ncbi:MAG: NADPH-dependent glutamate synthase [Spirochaetes bacterium]|nr:NADPH-dependent glutamate synthase [Spirochaetota bacterium]
MPEQPAEQRVKNFSEVLLGYDEETAKREASRCLQCKHKPCENGCPAKVKIPEFIALTREGKFLAAAKKIKETNSLPAVCGRVCPQETQCEEVCVLAKRFEPVAIGKLEMFVADYERKMRVAPETLTVPKNGFSVAIVGGGPAGIACAGDLIRMGYKVTVFEALHQVGGVLVYGIPEFRLSNDTVEYEVENLKKLGVEFKTNSPVGLVVSGEELLKEYSAIFVGSGAGLPAFLGVEGENLNGVYSANEYLTRVNLMSAYRFPESDTPVIRHKRIAIFGGGNVAMDSCRTALRLGAEKVYCVYRRTEKEMPARVEEVHHAKEEGVEFRLLRAPVVITGDEKGFVNGVRTQVMELGEPDAKGRRRPVPVKDAYEDIAVDGVIVAIGNNPNPIIPKTTPMIQVNDHGNIIIDENHMTAMPGVFAGGDITRGAATVILAIGDGKEAALAIDRYLNAKND